MNKISRFGLVILIVGVAMLTKFGQVAGKSTENWIGFIAAMIGFALFMYGDQEYHDHP